MSSKPPSVPSELSSSTPSYEAIMRTARSQLQQRDLGSYEEIPLYFAWERLYAAANANCSTDWLEESHEAFQRRTHNRPMARQGFPPPPPTSSLRSRSASADHLKRQSALASSFLRSSTLSPSDVSSLTRTYRENASKMKALRASRSSPGLAREPHIDGASTRRSHRTNALIHELELEAELDNRIRKTKAKKKRAKARRIYESSSSADEDQLEATLTAKAATCEAKGTPTTVAPANLKGTTHGLSSTRQTNKTAMSWDIDLSNPASSKATPSSVTPIAVWTMHERQPMQTVMPIKAVASDQLRKAESTTQLQYPNDSVKQTGNEKPTVNGQVNLKPKALDITQDSSFLSGESDEPISPIPVVGSSPRGSLRMPNSSLGSESIESPSNFSSDESVLSPRQSEGDEDHRFYKASGNRESTSSRRSSRSASRSTASRSHEQHAHSDSPELGRSTRSASQTSGHHIEGDEGYEERNSPLTQRRDSQTEPSQVQEPRNSSAVTANEDNVSLRSSKRMSQQPTPNGNNTRDFSEEEEFKEEERRRSTRSVSQSDSERMQTGAKYTETRGTTQSITREDSRHVGQVYSDEKDYASPVRHRPTSVPISVPANASRDELIEDTPPHQRPNTSSQSIRASQEAYLNEGEGKSVNHRRATELTPSRQRSVDEPASNLVSNAGEAPILRRAKRSEHIQRTAAQEHLSALNDEDEIHELQFQRILMRPEADSQSIRSAELRDEESIRRSSRSSEKAAATQCGNSAPIVKDEDVSGSTRVESAVSVDMHRDQISDFNRRHSTSQSVRRQREVSVYETDEQKYEPTEISPSMNQGTPMPSGCNGGDTLGDRTSRKESTRHSPREGQDINNKNKDLQGRAHISSRSSERKPRSKIYHNDEDELERTQIPRHHQQNTRSYDRRASNSNERSSDHHVRRTASHSATPSQNNTEFDQSSESHRAARTTNEVTKVDKRQELTQHHRHHHKQLRASQRSSSSHHTIEIARHSSPMNKIFGQSQGSEQWTSDESESELKGRNSSRSQVACEYSPASTSVSSDSSSRATTGQPAIVWPPGMEGGMKGMPSSRHHPCAPPGMEHLVTDKQLSEYWTWLHWYSSWQIWYLKNERKSSKRRGSSRKYSSHRHQEYAD